MVAYVEIIMMVRIDEARAMVAEVMVVVRRPERRREEEELRRRMSVVGGGVLISWILLKCLFVENGGWLR